MANESHLSLLKQGVEAWDKWREHKIWGGPDLSSANLSVARSDQALMPNDGSG
jgi:hypothetical protein